MVYSYTTPNQAPHRKQVGNPAGATPPTVAALGAHLEAAGLAKFKWPERVEIVSEFPQTSSGKTSKPLLRELIAQQLTTEPAAS